MLRVPSPSDSSGTAASSAGVEPVLLAHVHRRSGLVDSCAECHKACLGGKGEAALTLVCSLQAIIKYLQDQGVLILLTSSALARDDGNTLGLK